MKAVRFVVLLMLLAGVFGTTSAVAVGGNRIYGVVNGPSDLPYGYTQVTATCKRGAENTTYRVTIGKPGMSYSLEVGPQDSCRVEAVYRVAPGGTITMKSGGRIVSPVLVMNRVDLTLQSV